jgi:hypothetical protein
VRLAVKVPSVERLPDSTKVGLGLMHAGPPSCPVGAALRSAVVLALVFAGCGSAGGNGSTPSRATQGTVATELTIDSPFSGETVAGRATQVAGRAPAAPRDGETLVSVSVNRRRVYAEVSGTAYRADVALNRGHNKITARAEVFAPDADRANRVVRTRPVTISRRVTPGDGTGVLDLATAHYVATTWIPEDVVCGLAEECGTAAWCVPVSNRRVDCPVAWYEPGDVRRCYKVVSVRIVGRRLHAGSYACAGRVTPQPSRVVRRDAAPRMLRFEGTEYTDLTQPNRYRGPVRFDVRRDAYIP